MKKKGGMIMAKIDIDKFVASIMKCLCMPHREDAYMCRHWINKALDAQGLKFENGEIIKTQRMVVAEAKEALFDDDDDEKIRKSIICGMNALKANQKKKTFAAIPIDDCIAWLERQGQENMIEALRLEYEKGKADALQEQRKEWSAEDLLNRNEIADILQEYNRDDLIDWLEKQGKQSNNEEAEKEKNDYVSGQFLYCKGSFNEFKEGESYWLEYIGNDNYIGRSDNILNQKFHITPRQLYTWLDPRHDYRHRENCNDENNAPREYGKYEDENIRKSLIEFLESIWHLGKDAPFEKWDKSDCSKWITWLENQGENILIEEIKRRKELYSREKEKAVLFAEKLSLGGRIAVLEELLVFANEKQGEQKPILDFKASNWYVSKVDGKIHDLTYNPADKIKPKFKVGDWIIFNGFIIHIDEVVDGYYRTTTFDGIPNSYSWDIDNVARLWAIQDAKDGDVLISKNGKPFIYNGNYSSFNIGAYVGAYCGITCDDNFKVAEEKCYWTENAGIEPSNKEQCDKLFKAMKEAGYEWNAEKKELKKIHIIDEGKAEMDYCFTKMMNGENVSPAWSDEDEKIYQSIMDDTVQENQLNGKQINWLRDIKYRYFPQSKQKWSEEDEKMLHTIIADFKGFKHDNTSTLESHFNECIDWLKSLKCRVQPKQQWCAEDKDMLYKATAVVNRLCAEGKEYVWSVNTLKELFCWLKSLKTILEEN